MDNKTVLMIVGALLAIGAGYGACVMTTDTESAESELGEVDPPPVGPDASVMPDPVPPPEAEVPEAELPGVDVPENVLIACGDATCAPGQACCQTNNECVDPSCDGCCAGTMVAPGKPSTGAENPSVPEGAVITCQGTQCAPGQACCPSTGECVDPNDNEACEVDTFHPVVVAPELTPTEPGPAGPMPPPEGGPEGEGGPTPPRPDPRVGQ